MSLFVYECARAEHGHELRQWSQILPSLRKYFEGRNEEALLVINFCIGDVELDGLLIKNDAIVILELKDRSGIVHARMNGDWTCSDSSTPIHGGSGKNVYNQLRVNRAVLKNRLRDELFSETQTRDIQGLVVFTKLTEVNFVDFDRDTRGWVHVTDVAGIGRKMHDIVSRPYENKYCYTREEVRFSRDELFLFIRKKLMERMLVTEFSDVHELPADLYDARHPHDGKQFSTATQVYLKEQEVERLIKEREALLKKQAELEEALRSQSNEKDAVINKQQAELLALKEHGLQEKLREGENTSIELIKKLAQQMEDLTQSMAAVPPVRNAFTTDEKDSAKRVIPEKQVFERTPASERQPLSTATERPSKDFDIEDESLDEDQLDLIERTMDRNMLVTGPAGCGKSVIALHKARQMIEAGNNVIMIVFTKSLNSYMHGGATDINQRFYYKHQWERAGRPSADYIIVDEVQDFTRSEIKAFIAAARKNYFFFGDSAQSVMSFDQKKMSVEEIAEMTGLSILHLYNNYRLPRSVARITQQYLGLDVTPYSDKVYQNKEKTLPHIIQYASIEMELEGLIRIIKKFNSANVGILLPDNQSVHKLDAFLAERGIRCECKSYNPGHPDYKETLDFTTSAIKVMTYHSAKGLQFETVIIPFYQVKPTEVDRKILYVAMTRTFKNLFILYHTPVLESPLCDVPERLYLKTE